MPGRPFRQEGLLMQWLRLPRISHRYARLLSLILRYLLPAQVLLLVLAIQHFAVLVEGQAETAVVPILINGVWRTQTFTGTATANNHTLARQLVRQGDNVTVVVLNTERTAILRIYQQGALGVTRMSGTQIASLQTAFTTVEAAAAAVSNTIGGGMRGGAGAAH